jgi:hypothetical protein
VHRVNKTTSDLNTLKICFSGLAIAFLYSLLSNQAALSKPLLEHRNQIDFVLQTDPKEYLQFYFSKQEYPPLPPPLAIRGSICIFSPGLLENVNVIWSDRPLFMWQSDIRSVKMQRIQLFDPDNEQVLWEKALPDSVQSIAYDGTALIPGKEYAWQLEWLLLDREQNSWILEENDFRFSVMAADQRRSVTDELQEIIRTLEMEGASTEAIALQKSNHFQQQGLWTDSLQALHSVETPSEAVQQQIATLINSICPSHPTVEPTVEPSRN